MNNAIKNIWKEKISDPVGARLDNMDKGQLKYIFLGILLCVFLLDYFILMRPQLGGIMKINPEIKLLREKLVQSEQDFYKLRLYREEVKALEAKLDTANAGVTSRTEIPLILERISRIANKNHIKIDQLIPNLNGQEFLLENKQGRYYALPISIEGKSAYHNFGRFVNDLEHETIFFNIKLFAIMASRVSKSHNVRLTLTTIVLEPQSENGG